MWFCCSFAVDLLWKTCSVGICFQFYLLSFSAFVSARSDACSWNLLCRKSSWDHWVSFCSLLSLLWTSLRWGSFKILDVFSLDNVGIWKIPSLSLTLCSSKEWTSLSLALKWKLIDSDVVSVLWLLVAGIGFWMF